MTGFVVQGHLLHKHTVILNMINRNELIWPLINKHSEFTVLLPYFESYYSFWFSY